MLSESNSTGVSASRIVDISGWAAGSEDGIEGAGDTVTGINVATGESPLFFAGNGDRDGRRTEIGVVIEFEALVDDSRPSSSLAKSSSSFVCKNMR